MTSNTMSRGRISNRNTPNHQSTAAALPLSQGRHIPIPPSFTIDAALYQAFMQRNRLYEVLDGLLTVVDVKDLDAIEAVAQQMQQIIRRAPLPTAVASLIQQFYQLGYRRVVVWPITNYYVYAYTRDEQGEPFSRQASEVAGIIQGVRECWSTLFGARCIFYRELNGIRHEDAQITVAVQVV